MVLVVLAVASVSVLGWLLVDMLRENRLRYTAEDERWHAAFERILAAPVPSGPLAGPPGVESGTQSGTESGTDESHDWRLIPAWPERHPSEPIG